MDAGVCNEEKCDSVKEIQQKSAPDPTPKPEPEVEISDWSECKGDRKWQYRKVCEEGKRCKRGKQRCLSLPEWGKWSECESGWHYRERL